MAPPPTLYVAYVSSALKATNVEGVIRAADPPHMGLAPDPSVIRAIWDALLNAQNPLLVCGPDIAAAGAEEEILALAERLALPVATGIFDYGSFPVHHPNYAGSVESLSEEAYDVVCCVGYRQNTRGNAADLRFAAAGTIIGVGHDPAQLGNTFPLDIAVWGDVRHTLCGLNASWQESHRRLPHLERRAAAVRARGAERIRQLHEEAAGHASERPIHPNYLAHLAGELLPENTLLVSESFRNADHLIPFGFDKSQWRLVRTFGASLGHGIGAAIGAQLGAPDRPVVCSLGDGAVMYSASASGPWPAMACPS
jgi:thiamine pyrophosphate-dependent acetolactate synthase large subunit-like protein